MSAILVAALWPPFAALVWQLVRRVAPFLYRPIAASPLEDFFFDWVGVGILLVIIAACYQAWGRSEASAGSVAVALAIRWWLRRRRRDRAPLALGAKALALRAALVRKMRQSARPRSVLRPAPGGAR